MSILSISICPTTTSSENVYDGVLVVEFCTLLVDRLTCEATGRSAASCAHHEKSLQQFLISTHFIKILVPKASMEVYNRQLLGVG